MKKALALLLCAFFLLNAVACSQKPADTPTTPEETTPEVTTPEVTTPDDGPGEEPLPALTKKLTHVTIFAGESPAEVTAVKELKKYLEMKEVTVNKGGFPITLSIDSTQKEDGYRITSVLNDEEENDTESLTIAGGNGRGVLYGVYAFLEKCADVRFFTPTFEVCTAGDVVIGDGVLVDHVPTFEMRQTDWYNWMDGDTRHAWAAKRGINIMSGWSASWGEELGGSISYAPGLFVHTIGRLAELDASRPAFANNPCLSDPAVYDKVLANVRKALVETPDAKIISVSQNDNNNYCECEACMAVINEEGSPSGLWLRFVNKIAGELADEYPELVIDTLAYHFTQAAPKITKPAENVCIRLSSINCHFNHPITYSGCYNCSTFRKDIEAWSKICDRIYIWDYTTNYRYYIATFANFGVLQKNVEFFAKHNVKGVYEQGNGGSPSGEFGELRAYLLAKLLEDPYMGETQYYAHMDEFLAAYYGEGWQNIRKYIDLFIRSANTTLTPVGIYTPPFIAISQPGFAAVEKTIIQWWDAAEAAAGDRLEAVQRSRLQLRYMQLFIHPDAKVAAELIAEVQGLGMQWRESMWSVSNSSDLSLPPDKWIYVSQKPQ